MLIKNVQRPKLLQNLYSRKRPHKVANTLRIMILKTISKGSIFEKSQELTLWASLIISLAIKPTWLFLVPLFPSLHPFDQRWSIEPSKFSTPPKCWRNLSSRVCSSETTIWRTRPEKESSMINCLTLWLEEETRWHCEAHQL